jgi:hypothetical protein
VPGSRALCGSVYRAQTLTGLIGCGAPMSLYLFDVHQNPHESMRGRISVIRQGTP